MTPRGPVLARLDRPTGPRTTLAVVADPHVAPDATGTWKVFHRAETRFRAAISEANLLGVDACVLLGDLTKDGHPLEFERVDDALRRLDAPFVAVPGNHDVPKAHDDHEATPVRSFERRYTPGGLPFAYRAGGVDVLGVNTATTPDGDLRDTPHGRVGDAARSWLDDALAASDAPLVCLHHTPHPKDAYDGARVIDGQDDGLRDGAALLDVLARHDAVAFAGHTHWPAVGCHRGARVVTAPATCSLPQAFLHVTVDQSGTTVRLVPLADAFGVEEAYQYAATGTAHSQAIAKHTVDGYFERVPLHADREDPPTEPAPAPITRLVE